MPERPHDIPPDWWTLFCNGIPVHHFGPSRKNLAERYATDPTNRLAKLVRDLHPPITAGLQLAVQALARR
jgi:hypothetical protein